MWLGVWDGYNAPNNLPYWGFQYTTYRKDEMPELYEQIAGILKIVGIYHYQSDNKEWIAWHTTQKGTERFISLFYAVRDMGIL